MTTETLSPTPRQRFYDNNNVPAVGGQLFTYQAGTTTKLTTYKNSGGTANSNPVVMDARGECDLWVPPNIAYKYVFAPSTDSDPPTNPYWTVDNLVNSQLLTLYGGVDTGVANAYILTFVAQFTSYTDGVIIYWIPSHNNTGASTINVNGLGVVSILNQDGTALRPGQLIANSVVGILYKSTGFIILNVNASGLAPSLNTQNTNYTFTIGDAYNIVMHTDASTYVYTVPTNASVAFAIGTSIQVINQSNTSLQISPAGGVTLYPFGTQTLISGSIAIAPSTSTYITKTGSDTWQQSTLTSLSVDSTAYTGTLTGMTTTITGSILCKLVGPFVLLTITAAVTGTSNSTSMTLTGMPAGYRPSVSQKVVMSAGMQDNGIKVGGDATIATSGVITFGFGINGNPTGWTAAGFKGLQQGWTIMYPLI